MMFANRIGESQQTPFPACRDRGWMGGWAGALRLSFVVYPIRSAKFIRAERIVFSPDGDLLFTIDIHGIVSLWDLASRQVIYSFQALLNPSDWQYEPGVLALSPDGTSLVSISAIAWSKSENLLATGGWNPTSVNDQKVDFAIKLWQIEKTI